MNEVRSLDDLLGDDQDALAKRKLLVVDDKPEVGDGIRTSRLARSYEIVTAANGREGLARLAADPEIGVVLLDMLMPVMGGEEFLKQLRADQERYSPYVRVIVYTAFSGRGVDHAEILKQYGPVRFLTKATDPGVVEAEIRNAYTELDTELDVRRALAEAHGHEIELQRRLLEAEKEAAVGRLAAGVAHNLGNIVNSASVACRNLRLDAEDMIRVAALRRAAVELLRAGDDSRAATAAHEASALAADLEIDARAAGFLDRLTAVDQSLMDSARIVDRLRSYSRARTAQAEEVDLTRLVAEVLGVMGSELHSRRVRVSVTAPQHVLIHASNSDLRQVLHNLVQNALEAMSEVPTRELTIEVSESPGEAFLSVADSGPGISPADLPRIFEPYFTTKGIARGSGLGLSVSMNLVAAWNGRIDVNSSPGAGATFVVALPRQNSPTSND